MTRKKNKDEGNRTLENRGKRALEDYGGSCSASPASLGGESGSEESVE